MTAKTWQGSQVNLATTAFHLVPYGGSFNMTIVTEHGPFVLGNLQSRDDAEEIIDLVTVDVFGNWKRNGLTHVNADTVAAAVAAAEGHRTFERLAGM